ncbi:MAG: glycoside hydrolase family 28 protein [Sphaerochaetaceae bacterium]
MKTLSMAQCGGIGDGVFDNTQVFHTALTNLRQSGGGTLLLPAGTWRTGPIEMYSGCTLEIQKGATLGFIAEFERYPAVWTRWEGVECYAMHPCLYAHDAHGVAICGEGTVDGGGQTWWQYRNQIKFRKMDGPSTVLEHAFAHLNPDYQNQPGGGGGRGSQFLAPPCIQFYNCTETSIEGVSVVDSPFWTIHPVYCTDLQISHVTIRNPYEAPNTDGIDIDSCRDVTITDCIIDVGDDAIALKSGSGSNGIAIGRPTENVTVSHCQVSRAHGGIVIGSETAGGVNHVLASHNTFIGTDRGIRIKTRRGRGGAIFNLKFIDNIMQNNLCPVAINMYYRCGVLEHEQLSAFSLGKEPVLDTTPSIRNVTIERLHATGCKASAGFFVGLPEEPITDLSLIDCDIEVDGATTVPIDESEMYEGLPPINERGMRIRNCRDVLLKNVRVILAADPPFILEDNVRIVQE